MEASDSVACDCKTLTCVVKEGVTNPIHVLEIFYIGHEWVRIHIPPAGIKTQNSHQQKGF